MGSQKMADMGGLKPQFPDPFYYGVKDGLGSAIHQQQFIWSAFDERDANDVGSPEVECVDQVNHLSSD